MITQAIKGWLQKVFAWWPWKQSTPLEYQHVASAVTSGPAPETSFWISKEGTVPQASATPRRFTLESRTERLSQPFSEMSDAPPFSPLPDVFKPGAPTTEEVEKRLPDLPTPQQRLDFLRYLVQRGIVNEGFEEE